ncbi:hypothetical protein [Paraliobacillus sp. JSM ZJ581]|uniref:hypothetical protein n=1 Tax=Paraliobacillus sp. JSM ZJ581 TaxID=3342118 RepID=UPI0035A92373
METHDKKIVLFPRWKDEIEGKAFQFIREKKFNEALENLNLLLEYQETNQEVDIARLTCLIELGRQHEAEVLCEELLAKKDDYYFAYVHIYATLLFQANKYQDVSFLIDEVFEEEQTVPEPYSSQLNTLYQLNESLLKEQTDKQISATLSKLKDAIQKQDDVLQWHLVNHLHHSDISSFLALFKDMLKNNAINPMVKTVIIGLLQANMCNDEVTICKFSQTTYINPNTFPYMTDHPIYKKIKKELEEIEQKNPSLYELADQMLYRYFFVVYPFVLNDKNMLHIKDAIIYLSSVSFMDEKTLQDEYVSETLSLYIEDLLYYEKVYFSLMKK